MCAAADAREQPAGTATAAAASRAEASRQHEPGWAARPKTGHRRRGFTLAESRMAVCGMADPAATDLLCFAVAERGTLVEVLGQFGFR